MDTPEPQKPAPDYQKEIAEHLQSIRSMLKFFTFITVLYIIGSIFVGLLSF